MPYQDEFPMAFLSLFVIPSLSLPLSSSLSSSPSLCVCVCVCDAERLSICKIVCAKESEKKRKCECECPTLFNDRFYFLSFLTWNMYPTIRSVSGGMARE